MAATCFLSVTGIYRKSIKPPPFAPRPPVSKGEAVALRCSQLPPRKPARHWLWEGLKLSIAGLGIIFYSPKATEHIAAREKNLLEHYNAPKDVIKHIYEGTIVGIGTGKPGDFSICIYQEMYFNKVDSLPELHYEGVPSLI